MEINRGLCFIHYSVCAEQTRHIIIMINNHRLIDSVLNVDLYMY